MPAHFSSPRSELAGPLRFFLACVPPTTTHQHKRIVRRGPYAGLADRPELVQARHDLEALLLPFVPPAPLSGPLCLVLAFTWPWRAGDSRRTRAAGRQPKVTRPDCSNLAKTLEDRLVFLRFLEDDAQVAELHVEKWHGDQAGIGVTLAPWWPATGQPVCPSCCEPLVDRVQRGVPTYCDHCDAETGRDAAGAPLTLIP